MKHAVNKHVVVVGMCVNYKISFTVCRMANDAILTLCILAWVMLVPELVKSMPDFGGSGFLLLQRPRSH